MLTTDDAIKRLSEEIVIAADAGTWTRLTFNPWQQKYTLTSGSKIIDNDAGPGDTTIMVREFNKIVASKGK